MLYTIVSQRLSIRKKIAKGVSYMLQVNCAYLGRIIHLLGAPIGNKTKTPFNVPRWILNNRNCKRRFLQALLEDELTTIRIRRCNYSVRPRLKFAKKEELIPDLKEFMKEIKKIIESFGVHCNHISKPVPGNNTDTLDLYFHIYSNKRNIMRFKEKIGFRLNQEKIKKLNHCYEILKNTL